MIQMLLSRQFCEWVGKLVSLDCNLLVGPNDYGLITQETRWGYEAVIDPEALWDLTSL